MDLGKDEYRIQLRNTVTYDLFLHLSVELCQFVTHSRNIALLESDRSFLREI